MSMLYLIHIDYLYVLCMYYSVYVFLYFSACGIIFKETNQNLLL